GLGAERLEDQEHLVALDQLARLLDRLRRTERVVIADEVDLAAIDAALDIVLVEIGRLRLADRAIGRRRAAIGHYVADLDFGVARTGIVFLLRAGRTRDHCGDRERRQGSKVSHTGPHRFLPIVLFFDQSCCRQVSQATSPLASIRLFRMTKQHCCLTPIVIDAGWRHFTLHACKARGWTGIETENTNWSAASEARGCGLPC